MKMQNLLYGILFYAGCVNAVQPSKFDNWMDKAQINRAGYFGPHQSVEYKGQRLENGLDLYIKVIDTNDNGKFDEVDKIVFRQKEGEKELLKLDLPKKWGSGYTIHPNTLKKISADFQKIPKRIMYDTKITITPEGKLKYKTKKR